MSFPSDEMLEKYAELIVKVGLNIKPGQKLLMVIPAGTMAFLSLHIH